MNSNGIQLDRSCRNCANFKPVTESGGDCSIESRRDQKMKQYNFISCFFFKEGGVKH